MKVYSVAISLFLLPSITSANIRGAAHQEDPHKRRLHPEVSHRPPHPMGQPRQHIVTGGETGGEEGFNRDTTTTQDGNGGTSKLNDPSNNTPPRSARHPLQRNPDSRTMGMPSISTGGGTGAGGFTGDTIQYQIHDGPPIPVFHTQQRPVNGMQMSIAPEGSGGAGGQGRPRAVHTSQRQFMNEIGVQAPLGFFDPLGTVDGEEDSEHKHHYGASVKHPPVHPEPARSPEGICQPSSEKAIGMQSLEGQAPDLIKRCGMNSDCENVFPDSQGCCVEEYCICSSTYPTFEADGFRCMA